MHEGRTEACHGPSRVTEGSGTWGKFDLGIMCQPNVRKIDTGIMGCVTELRHLL